MPARRQLREARAPHGGAGRERSGERGGTVALAVRNSASWLMLETSGELFMITRMRDRGSDTGRLSLTRAAIFPAAGARPAARWEL